VAGAGEKSANKSEISLSPSCVLGRSAHLRLSTLERASPWALAAVFWAACGDSRSPQSMTFLPEQSAR